VWKNNVQLLNFDSERFSLCWGLYRLSRAFGNKFYLKCLVISDLKYDGGRAGSISYLLCKCFVRVGDVRDMTYLWFDFNAVTNCISMKSADYVYLEFAVLYDQGHWSYWVSLCTMDYFRPGGYVYTLHWCYSLFACFLGLYKNYSNDFHRTRWKGAGGTESVLR